MPLDKKKLEKRLWQLCDRFKLDDTIENGEWGYDALLSKLYYGEDHWKKGETLEEWFNESIEQLEEHLRILKGWLKTLKILKQELEAGKFEVEVLEFG